MEPIDYLHLQMRLEGIGLSQQDLIKPLFPGSESPPLVLIAQIAGIPTVAYFHEMLPAGIREELAGLVKQAVFPDVKSIVNILKSAGFRPKIGHFRTYGFPAIYSKTSVNTVKTFPRDDPKIKAFGFGGFADQVYAVEEGGVIISACVSARQNAECAEAWVFTAPENRQKGLAQRVVTAWANGMFGQDMIPFYSHKVENLASAQLAYRLGLFLIYDELVVEEKPEG